MNVPSKLLGQLGNAAAGMITATIALRMGLITSDQWLIAFLSAQGVGTVGGSLMPMLADVAKARLAKAQSGLVE